MDFARLQTLRELAEHGTVTRVAQVMHVTPSAVSQQIKALEREMGMPLIEPDGRRVRLTDAGLVLAEGAIYVSAALERVQASWDDFLGEPVGTVDVSAFPTAGQMMLPGVLTRIKQTTSIQLHFHDRDVEQSDFEKFTSEFDIVLAHSPEDQDPWADAGLTVVQLMREPIEIALPLGHRLADAEYVTAEDVVDETWIGVPSGYPFDSLISQIQNQTGRKARVDQRFADTSITEAFVTAGHGIAFLPRYTADDREGTRFLLKRLRGIHAGRNIVALMRQDRAERLAVRLVLSELLAVSNEIVGAAPPH